MSDGFDMIPLIILTCYKLQKPGSAPAICNLCTNGWMGVSNDILEKRSDALDQTLDVGPTDKG